MRFKDITYLLNINVPCTALPVKTDAFLACDIVWIDDLVKFSSSLGQMTYLLDHWSSNFLCDVGKFLPHCMASHLRKQQSSKANMSAHISGTEANKTSHSHRVDFIIRTNKMQLFCDYLFLKGCTCFWRFLRPVSASDIVNQYCCRLVSWMRYLKLNVQLCTPDDGRRNRPKHVEPFRNK